MMRKGIPYSRHASELIVLLLGMMHVIIQGVSKNGNPTLTCHCALIDWCIYERHLHGHEQGLGC